jgi:MHS family alpha-ketoglutarate permease-like MFS transporter
MTTIDSSTTSPAKLRFRGSGIFSAATGNAVEAYDWSVYALYATFIAKQMFSPADPASAFISTLAVFGIGFTARPLGGWLFGWMGDRMGRKSAMMLCIGLASLGSLIIAVTPGYAMIGGWASFILVVARLLQGLAHGGEFPTAQTYIAEVVPAQSRGLWSSAIYVSATAGIVFATILGAILSSFINAQAMESFGWRVPFAVGAVLGIYTLIMRRRMPESEAFEENKAKKATGKTSMWTSVAQHWHEALQVIGLTLGLTIAFYTWNVSAPSMAINVHKLNLSEALWAGTVANVLFLLFLPFWGGVSDKIGRKPVLAIGFLGAAAAHFPAISLIDNTGFRLVLAMTIVTFFIAAVASIIPAVFAEMFPTAIRNVGVAVPYSICVAAFGGTAVFIQAGLNQAMGPASGATVFGIYVAVSLVVSAITVLSLRETRGRNIHDAARPAVAAQTT